MGNAGLPGLVGMISMQINGNLSNIFRCHLKKGVCHSGRHYHLLGKDCVVNWYFTSSMLCLQEPEKRHSLPTLQKLAVRERGWTNPTRRAPPGLSLRECRQAFFLLTTSCQGKLFKLYLVCLHIKWDNENIYPLRL